MPFYPITTKGDDKRRVIEADNPAAALRHVAEAAFTVGKPMKPTDLVAHMQAGNPVEKAGEVAAEPEADKGADA
jgi:hypothetical protein